MNKELKFTGSSSYYLNQELASIVNMAIAMEKPLLLTGEPGTGKTQLAMEISRGLKMPIEILRCKSTIRGEESCYIQDTVLRLNDSRFGGGSSKRDVENFYDYIIWGPIGRAFRCETRTVLLLDEIDKTESDVQDNLLDVLENSSFTIREVNDIITAKEKPIIIITSNSKRELSDPFLRRCFAHSIAFPDEEEMRKIIALHFDKLDEKLVDACLNIFYQLRQRGYEKAPATSELLDWIEALRRSNIVPQDVNDIAFVGTLLKRSADLQDYVS